ncbi:Predicted arabinose efflux permease, MFS family [Amycolatopsis xylanica]|uniref:Predicted arabinose efflux permease, MFS family n=1 Tax=Amycolatopsis xylanica TaxID=589385 RepID=A0A1H2ZAA5_9PSEU|nr:MFS transporter [Amycolatopsis xylanica]SDX13719.1 Predicted arabinose efflux permease, MFS family [Amycolatopsis xylanica]
MTIRRSSNDRLVLGPLLILAVGTFILGTDGFVLNGLLPTIAADLHVSESVAGQLTTVFAATYAIGSPLIAAFTGSWDRKRLLGAGLVLFTIGMAGQALGESFTIVAISRVLAALGAAAFQANAYVMASAIAPEARRGQALATVAAGMSVSMVLGVPIGVLAGNLVGWRAVMWGIGALGILVALAVPALPSVRVPTTGLRDRLAVIVRPPIARVLGVTVLAMLATFGVATYLPVIAKDVAAGAVLAWVLVGNGIGQVIGTTLAGRWTDRFGPDRVRLVSLSGVASALLLLDFAVLSLPSTIVYALLIGGFAGMLMVPQQHRLFSLAPDAPSVALGLNGSAIYAGGALGSAVGGVVLAWAGPKWLGPVAAVSVLLALALSKRREKQAAAHDRVHAGNERPAEAR